MVKGHSKVTQHLMFGVITLFADQLIRLLGQIFKERQNSLTAGDLRQCGHKIIINPAK